MIALVGWLIFLLIYAIFGAIEWWIPWMMPGVTRSMLIESDSFGSTTWICWGGAMFSGFFLWFALRSGVRPIHPIEDLNYCKWLQITPWLPGEPTPFRFQWRWTDTLWVTTLFGFLVVHKQQPLDWLLIPRMMGASALIGTRLLRTQLRAKVSLLESNEQSKASCVPWVTCFAVPTVIWIGWLEVFTIIRVDLLKFFRLEATALALLGLCVVVWTAQRNAMLRFPWTNDSATIRQTSAAIAASGYPWSAIGPDAVPPPSRLRSRWLLLSLTIWLSFIAGHVWQATPIAHQQPNDQWIPAWIVTLLLTSIACLVCRVEIGSTWLTSMRLWVRLRCYGRLIEPRYHVAWVRPLGAWLLTGVWLGLAAWGNWPIVVFVPGAVALTMGILLWSGPRREHFQLTAPGRMMPPKIVIN